MSKMRVAQVIRAKGTLEIVEREIPEPDAGSVRVNVEACGICHSDSFTKDGHWPGIQYPRIPGHEIAGIVDAVGNGVAGWTQGQRVGVGWHGGHCGYCDSCRRGDFVTCQIALQIPGIAYDSGYAEYMTRSRRRIGADPGGTVSGRCGTADVCGGHHFQPASQQRRAAGRSRRRTRHRRSRSLGNSIRREDGIQDRCDCARDG